MVLLLNGKDVCTCPKTRCERWGRCAECVAHHGKKAPRCKR